MSSIAVAAVLAATILVASMVSVEIGLSVALVELFAGVVVGNVFHVAVPGWLDFVGSFAGISSARRPAASHSTRRAP